MTGIPFLGDVDLGRHLGFEARASWLAVADLAETFDHQTWMAVGGQMVLIYAARTGVTMPRVTTDIDVVVDVRAARRAHAERISAWLVERGFAIERNDEGTDRYRRDDARIDLLAPDNLGRRPVSTADGGRILAAPGSTNAFKRSVTVRCVLGDGLAPAVRCSTAFGALLSTMLTTCGAEGAARARHRRPGSEECSTPARVFRVLRPSTYQIAV